MPAARARLEAEVRSHPVHAAVAGNKVGTAAPADADFNRTPPNGTIVVNNTGVYVRVGGTWERVTLDSDA